MGIPRIVTAMFLILAQQILHMTLRLVNVNVRTDIKLKAQVVYMIIQALQHRHTTPKNKLALIPPLTLRIH